MLFTVLETGSWPSSGRNQGFLVVDQWNDWRKFRTMFDLVVFDDKGNSHEIGKVKIGERGLEPGSSLEEEPGKRSPSLPPTFDSLTEIHFSVGQSQSYYEALNEIGEELRLSILRGLRDCAFDNAIFEASKSEVVMGESLLRDVSELNVRHRFHRLAHGDSVLTEFHFEYRMPSRSDSPNKPPILDFHVTPSSEPPSNVHVLIGTNGVGKTYCMKAMANALLGRQPESEEDIGEFHRLGDKKDEWEFTSLVGVSFSAFDSFYPDSNENSRIKTSMIGLRYINSDRTIGVKTHTQLAQDFAESFGKCRTGLRRVRWLEAVNTLGSDSLFHEEGVTQLLNLGDTEWLEGSLAIFGKLSSGHASILLTITRLVELVDERTLVLLDEPEGHLHPPLLSAFVRALSDLLVKRNGVAIVSTHSPVVLQEVPKSCVWMMRRSGRLAVAERPAIETFGENVGILTREVFGLQVTSSGFHKLINNVVEDDFGTDTFEDILSHFHGQLGAEARAIAMAMLLARKKRGA